jgi:hypothetical protein
MDPRSPAGGEPPRLWRLWLLSAVAGVGVFGLTCVLLPDVIAAFFNLLIFGRTVLPTGFGLAAAPYLSFVYGVLGAVMLGWAVLMMMVVEGPFRRGERAGWHMIALPFGVWFVVDSTWSLSTGYWQNALLNAAFALAFAIPLAATWRHFHRR